MRAWNKKKKPKFTTKTKHKFNWLVDSYIFYARDMGNKMKLRKIKGYFYTEKYSKVPEFVATTSKRIRIFKNIFFSEKKAEQAYKKEMRKILSET